MCVDSSWMFLGYLQQPQLYSGNPISSTGTTRQLYGSAMDDGLVTAKRYKRDWKSTVALK